MKHLFVLPLCLLLLCFISQEHVTIFMAGDSTMQTYKDLNNPIRGWGQVFQQFFTDQVTVENHAMGGRSTKSFIAEGRWQRLIEKVKQGDYVFIQFGHNDASKNKPERYTTIEDFKTNLKKMINETREKGAFPVLLTQTSRRQFGKDSIFNDGKNLYVEATKDVASETKTPLIDMNAESMAMVKSMGPVATKKLYMCFAPGENPLFPEGKEDNTHLQELGATKMAAIAVKGIQKLNLDLGKYLKK